MELGCAEEQSTHFSGYGHLHAPVQTSGFLSDHLLFASVPHEAVWGEGLEKGRCNLFHHGLSHLYRLLQAARHPVSSGNPENLKKSAGPEKVWRSSSPEGKAFGYEQRD